MIFVFGCSEERDTAKGHQRDEREDVCENDIVVGGISPSALRGKRGTRHVGSINGEMRKWRNERAREIDAGCACEWLGGHCHARMTLKVEHPVTRGGRT